MKIKLFLAATPQRVLWLIPFFAISSAVIAGPRIQFASPAFEFGRITCGELVNYSFIFTNLGDQTLELSDVRPSCGCTTAGAYDRTVAPGKTGRIPIQFNSANASGAVGKTVIVLCNDPTQTNIVLQIKGTVWKPIQLTPTVASFRVSSDVQTNETRRIQIVSNLEEPLQLSQPECTNKAFQATLRTVRPGKEFELAVTFLNSQVSVSTAAPITLKTSSTNVPQLTINAYALVQPAIVASPTQLVLPSGPLPSGVQLNANIVNNGPSQLVLSDPSMEPPVAKVRVQELNPGRQFMLIAEFPPGFQPQQGQNGEIRVKTNHPQQPVVTIPVIGGHTLAATLRDVEATPPNGERGLKSTQN